LVFHNYIPVAIDWDNDCLTTRRPSLLVKAIKLNQADVVPFNRENAHPKKDSNFARFTTNQSMAGKLLQYRGRSWLYLAVVEMNYRH